MLNRVNEYSILQSYSGIYNIYGEGITLVNDCNGSQILKDSKLCLKAVYRKTPMHIDMSCPSGSNISALFFGELYNFKELADKINWPVDDRHNLTFSHLTALLYRKYGISFVKHINGMFSLILRDPIEEVFLVAVDRFGSDRPIYYSVTSKLYFASHLRILLLNHDCSREIDKDSLTLFLKYSYIPSPSTIFKNIKTLRYGEMIVCRKNNYRIERYSDFNIKKQSYSVDEAVDRYKNLLKNSISHRLEKQNGQRIGILLSGGLDSSANVAFASELDTSFQTFGIGFENPIIDERPFARNVAEHFNVPFNDYTVSGNEIEDLPKIAWHLEQPFFENGLILTYAAFKSAEQKADIIISGNCTDQLFGTGGFAGARPIALRYILEKIHLLSFAKMIQRNSNFPICYKDNILFQMKALLDRVISFNNWFYWGFTDHELTQLCNLKNSSKSTSIFEDKLNEGKHSFEKYYDFSIVTQDLEHYACQNVLVKSYRLSEMLNIYERDPYLDHELVDFILSLDISFKRKGNLFNYLTGKTESKYLHRLAMRDILPPSILNKPKQGGCINTDILLSSPAQNEKIFRYIENSKSTEEYFNKNFVKNLLLEYAQLLKKPINFTVHREAYANKILYLLVFLVWSETFLEGNLKYPPNVTLSELIS